MMFAGPPDTPVIHGSSQMTENVPTTLTCMADMGYPNDWMLDWFNEDTPIMPMAVTTPAQSGSRYTFSSQIEFTPTRQDNRNTIKCTAQRDSWNTQPLPEGSWGPIGVQCKYRSQQNASTLHAVPNFFICLKHMHAILK